MESTRMRNPPVKAGDLPLAVTEMVASFQLSWGKPVDRFGPNLDFAKLLAHTARVLHSVKSLLNKLLSFRSLMPDFELLNIPGQGQDPPAPINPPPVNLSLNCPSFWCLYISIKFAIFAARLSRKGATCVLWFSHCHIFDRGRLEVEVGETTPPTLLPSMPQLPVTTTKLNSPLP